MKQIDLDGDEMIQYTEFLLACCNKRSLFTDINIKKCFDYIDSNLDGEICDKDLKIFVGDSANDYQVLQMIQEADENGDGGLELKEFSDIMKKILKSTERNK